MRVRDAALLVVLGVAWGAVYPLTSLLLRYFPPTAVVLGRTGLSMAALLPFTARAGTLRHAFTHPVQLLGAALLQAAIPLMLLTLGQQHVKPGLAGIILASQPVWAAILTGVLDHVLRIRELAGVLVGLTGIAVLARPGASSAATSAWGLLALIGAAACYAAGAVYIQRVIPEIPPGTSATAAMAISTAVLLPFGIAEWPRAPGWGAVGWLAVLAVCATGFPLVLYYALIRRTGPVRASLAGYLAPGFALIGSLVIFREVPTTEEVFGLALIVGGSCLTASSQESRTGRHR